MRIAVVAPGAVPPTVGGAERLYEGLVAALAGTDGVTCDLVTMPSPEYSFLQLLDSYEQFGELDLSAYDRVISTKYPSWMVRHPDHIVYMLHTLRGLYDSYAGFGMGTELPDRAHRDLWSLVQALRIPPGTRDGWREVLGTARQALAQFGDDDPLFVFPGPLIRRVVRWFDRDALDASNVRAHYAISRTVATRPDYFPATVPVGVLLPPTNLSGLRCEEGRNFFTASRLDIPKRIELLIQAMDFVEEPIELRIAGTGPDEERLKSLRPDDGRIVFLGRISESRLVDEYAAARAVPFIPYDEDFGLVTLEAQLASKPVVTCHDSGGVTELVSDGVNGRIVEPNPEAIGAALSELARDPGRARLMGLEGRRQATGVTWERIVEALTAAPQEALTPGLSGPSGQPRPKIVVLSTYAAVPPKHGGQFRLNRLLCGLVEHYDVDLLALAESAHHRSETTPIPGLRQIVIPTGSEQRRLESALAAQMPIPIGDIAASLYGHHTSEYLAALRASSKHAVGAILEQPYLLPLLRRACPRLPFVYDSQNAEAEMKTELLGDAPGGETVLAAVRAVEQEAVRGAELVAVCSTQDREKLARLGPTLADWTLVPNGADVLETPFVTGDERSALRDAWLRRYARTTPYAQPLHLAIFVGSYHPPNLAAAEAIVAMAGDLPDVCFVLAGSQGHYFESWQLPYNVVVTGMVDKRYLRHLLASADVALNPVESGGGTNLKLIEYFAAGVPVVSTRLGCRGVAVTDDRELLIRDVSQFAAAIRNVIAQPEKAEERAHAGRRLVELGFDWTQIAARYTEDVRKAFGR